ncbi:methyltransferase family protein [Flexibacterium corallicola]|uniref:methyltransferase family protein n=1 Tax=Flexibacterium corallicola TaxID=3037259 RepID=UPI00286EE177|nr:isoprenylcysteine carboxylmethyltransferase family protein [Pseudovibrio sp. M1P-2-3]
MKFLELKVHPLIIEFVTAGLMWALAKAIPGYPLPHFIAVLGFLTFAIAGCVLVQMGKWRFGQHQTTHNPTRPESASALVTGGIYGITRNPMYLGMLLILVGWSIYLSSMAAFLALLIYVFYLNMFQIKPEEEALKKLFGKDYEDYCQRVRRWL